MPDYAALAEQARQQAAPPVDYAALAEQARHQVAPPAPIPGAQSAKPEPKTVTGFLGNVVSSGANLVGNMAKTGVGLIEKPVRKAGEYITGQPIAPNPEEDQAYSMLSAPFGAIEKPVRKAGELLTGKPIPKNPEEESADAVGQFYKQRYGGLENIKNTLYQDPVGAAMDASMVAGGAAAGLRGAANVADAANLSRTSAALRTGAGTAARVAERTNPVIMGAKGAKVLKGAASDAGEAIGEAVMPTDPHDALFRAIKPRANRLNFSKALESALPDIKAVENQNAPIEDVSSALDHIQKAKLANRAAYDRFRGPARAMGSTVDLTPAADATAASIPHDIAFEAAQGVPDAVAARNSILKQAEAYRTIVPIAKAEELLRAANAKLDDFYAKYPRQQWKALATNPETAPLYARAEALRDAIYDALDDPNQGDGARNLQRRYGNLLEVEQELQRRKNVADRQQPQNLAQQLSTAQAAGHYARGAARLLGGDVSGAADIAGAGAQRAVSDWIKEQQTTNALIRRGFKAYDGKPVPFPEPARTQIRGYLTAAQPGFLKGELGSSAGDIITPSGVPPTRDLAMAPLDSLDEANLRPASDPLASLEATSGNLNRDSRRATVAIPAQGTPENVARAVDLRDSIAKKLSGKPYLGLKNSERLAVDDLINESRAGSSVAQRIGRSIYQAAQEQ